jgi:threonine/homoserine/homoserine lactone efflux protein
MVSIEALLGFSAIALGVALTPGPNMVYVTSRSLIHGRWAGMVALSGMTFGALCYLALAAFGVAVLLSAVPHAYDVLRIAGAIYLGYLAWKSVHAAGWINVAARPVSREGHSKLFSSGLLVCLFNPATALLYLTVIPRFVDSSHGSVVAQTIVLGLSYVVINGSIKAIAIVLAGALARIAVQKPGIARVQNWASGIVLAVLALNLGFGARPPSATTATAATQQVTVIAADQTQAVANETDRRVAQAGRLPDVVGDPPRSEQANPYGAIARTFEPAVDRPQAGAETRPSLLREFGRISPFAFVDVPPEAKRGLAPHRRRLVERKMYRQRSAHTRPLARPKPVPVARVVQKQVQAVPAVAHDRLAGPGIRPEGQR